MADGGGASRGPAARATARRAAHYAPSGVFGDPTLASWQKGERIVEQAVADLLAGIDALAPARPFRRASRARRVEPAVREAARPRTP